MLKVLGAVVSTMLATVSIIAAQATWGFFDSQRSAALAFTLVDWVLIALMLLFSAVLALFATIIVRATFSKKKRPYRAITDSWD
jgi:chromate transport protein ChrA